MGSHKFICHRDYTGVIAGGNKKEYSFHRGEEYDTIGPFIATKDSIGICFTSSQIGHQHFAINDDGMGLRRGDLTHAIAFADREREDENHHVFRFTKEEQEIIYKDWKHFLKEDLGVILFNHRFFTASIEELEAFAKAIHISI